MADVYPCTTTTLPPPAWTYTSRRTATRVRRLRREGLSYRQIAARLGISRSTVGNILSTDWRPRNRRTTEPPAMAVPCEPYRCSGCGGMVVTRPCLTCLLRGGAG